MAKKPTALVVRTSADVAQDRRAATNPAMVYLASLAPGSRPSQASALRKIAAIAAGPGADPFTLPWWRLRYEHTNAIRAKLVDGFAHTTVNRHLSALRGVLTQAWKLELMPAEDYQRAVDLKAARGHRELAGRALEQDELETLFRECRTRVDPMGRRDSAVLGLLFGGGLRRFEVARVLAADYNAAKRYVRVVGKGNKERTIYLPKRTAQLLDAWLPLRKGGKDGPLFLRCNRWGVTTKPLSVDGISLIVRRHSAAAQLASMSTHDARRTYISDAIDRTGDLSAIAGQVGHANVATTARYDRRGDRAKQAVAATVRLPEE